MDAVRFVVHVLIIGGLRAAFRTITKPFRRSAR